MSRIRKMVEVNTLNSLLVSMDYAQQAALYAGAMGASASQKKMYAVAVECLALAHRWEKEATLLLDQILPHIPDESTQILH